MKLSPLRVLLVLDAVVLFLLGALLILAPRRVEFAFQFKDLPEGVSYIIGLWGCVLMTMAIGYAVAAADPSLEWSTRSSASSEFLSWEGLGVGKFMGVKT